MSPSEPLVSLGMPLFNVERTLASSLRSIINQTYENWELVLIDDGSTDASRTVIREFHDPRIRPVEGGDNKGYPFRLAQAVQLSMGEYFARMDADDIAYPERLRKQVDFLVASRDVDLVGSRVIVFRGAGVVLGARGGHATSHESICAKPSRGIQLAHPTWMGRLVWFRSNPYSPGAGWAADQELLQRTYRHSRFACLPEILLGYREESISISKSFRGRVSVSRALIRQGVASHDSSFVVAAAGQALKFGADAFAALTGLEYRLLRHRATPATAEEVAAWRKVWAECSEAGGSG